MAPPTAATGPGGDDTGYRFVAFRAAATPPSAIQILSRLAQSTGAINLAEGYPDFPAPAFLKAAAVAAIERDENQYAHPPELRAAIAARALRRHGLAYDPETEVVVTCGQTEALAAAVLATVNPGDEVVLFDPAYDTYAAAVRLAGGVVKRVSLRPPTWVWRHEELRAAFGAKTKAIIVNSPCNPTGRVLTPAELEQIASLCRAHDCLALCDDVYEDLTYGGAAHRPLAALPGMRGRTVITSSLSKTFGVTGWRVGWAMAPAPLAAAMAAVHVKLTDSAPSPFMRAAVTALTVDDSFYASTRDAYRARRDAAVAHLRTAGFGVDDMPSGWATESASPPDGPAGGVFVFARLPAWATDRGLDDVTLASALITAAGVAVLPGSVFFGESPAPEWAHRYVRVAFCKATSTLDVAGAALTAWAAETRRVEQTTCAVA